MCARPAQLLLLDDTEHFVRSAPGFARIDEVLTTSVVVSVHLRLSEESRWLFGERGLQSMKPGRCSLTLPGAPDLDEGALHWTVIDSPLRAAGLDVYVEEPLPAASPLRGLPTVVLAPTWDGQWRRGPRSSPTARPTSGPTTCATTSTRRGSVLVHAGGRWWTRWAGRTLR